MTILQRIFTLGQPEAHPSVEELKEPIKRTEQGIREMRLELEKNVRALETLAREAIGPESWAPAPQDRADLEGKINALKVSLRKWEMELRVLKARVTVSNATKTINRQMAQLNSPGSLTLLENLKEKEASAQAQFSGGSLSGKEEPAKATEKPQASCTAQAFSQKADALNDRLGPTPAPDAPTATQP
ncbi:PspA/IM30 family protein [Rufibacter glacialis]|uniref:PspA/IM30 family protein n=1 Tax=Rufibacter glacialis TaxID=1259555 RepID=A0A5M8Q4L1_9BACT|nr:hypothetical protein [Rufibacter glacialis]KAA6430779.1 hypothetical protein FOE74_20140 [Rufibacter glacialis]GGK86655.1 hypothetical protein GCM10011405_38030 [Rufibacter glacialis]